MPSTNPPPPLTLALRRAEIRAFAIVTTVALSLALALSAAASGAPVPWAWGILGLGLPLPALIWPRWLEAGVRAWNKGVRLGTVVLNAYVLRVGYYLLFAAVGRTGSSLDLELGKAGVSRWISRAPHERAFGDCDRLAAEHGRWVRELLASVGSRSKVWQVCLFPVLLLLMVLGREGQENALPSSTYTLY